MDFLDQEARCWLRSASAESATALRLTPRMWMWLSAVGNGTAASRLFTQRPARRLARSRRKRRWSVAKGENPLSGDYEVGFGRPPARTQFRKGVSGNPKGRPKGARNVSSVLAKLCGDKVSVTINGKARSMTALEALLMRLRASALSGDLKANREFLSALRAFPEPVEAAPVSPASS